ncbi:pol polyprotein [Echinococcus granulosus]|uniref:Pol polyprotein n=1 Tax=Echinococcus granulosus TaxID=6210 RepID=W6UBR9_ECHGR|nr:pol polyprotein [Echinococcus granulosus]EUB58560.1 pol polyprotein [Echinococcus granulosus]
MSLSTMPPDRVGLPFLFPVSSQQQEKRTPRIPPPLLEEVNSLVEEMLQDEVIKPSKSLWASPIKLAKKDNGSLRLYIDSPDPPHGSQWFFTLDLKLGYWQVEAHSGHLPTPDANSSDWPIPKALYIQEHNAELRIQRSTVRTGYGCERRDRGRCALTKGQKRKGTCHRLRKYKAQ